MGGFPETFTACVPEVFLSKIIVQFLVGLGKRAASESDGTYLMENVRLRKSLLLLMEKAGLREMKGDEARMLPYHV